MQALIQKFLDKWQGKQYHELGMQTTECVGVTKLACREILGFTLGSFGGSAKTGWQNIRNTFDPRYWRWVKNTPKNSPKAGDVIFWDLPSAKPSEDYDHVAFVISGDVQKFKVIEGNRTGKRGDAPGDEIRVSEYNYDRVLGWFSPIFKLPIDEVKETVIDSIKTNSDPCPILPANPHKVLVNYNQEVHGHCGIFGVYGQLAYNTGKVFKNTRVRLTASIYCKPDCWQVESVNAIKKQIPGIKSARLQGGEAEKAYDLGYALMIAIVAPTEMIVDGIRDGKIDGQYNRDIRKSHILFAYKEKGKYYLGNSLGKYKAKGLHNQYEISKEQLDIIRKGSNQYLIY